MVLGTKIIIKEWGFLNYFHKESLFEKSTKLWFAMDPWVPPGQGQRWMETPYQVKEAPIKLEAWNRRTEKGPER